MNKSIIYRFLKLYGLLQIAVLSVAGKLCRDRGGVYFYPKLFEEWTCAQCYKYILNDRGTLQTVSTSEGFRLSSNGSIFPVGTLLKPDALNESSKVNVCRTMKNAECERWMDCCKAAKQCCENQLSKPHVLHGKFCPRTWDGYGCFEDTSPGKTAYINCPSYVDHYAVVTEQAFQVCTDNGTWRLRESQEWTNYTSCLSTDSHRITVYISISFYSISIIALIPAFVILVSYRQLYTQDRIKLHLNFFACFIVNDVAYLLWEILVNYDRLVMPATESLMHKNTVGCRFLHALTRYTKSATYVWMFLEGYYLHRLIVKIFANPKSLVMFYIIGWGFPMIPVIIYGVIRSVLADENCWVKEMDGVEWVLYTPNFLCLLMNIFFLFNIMRILLTKLKSHPNEPSNYRRGMKATFILIPPFGIQLLLIIYRPSSGLPGAEIYYYIEAFMDSTQGFFVALVFCFFNGEVHSFIKKTCLNAIATHRFQRRDSTRRSLSLTTQTMVPLLKVTGKSSWLSKLRNKNRNGICTSRKDSITVISLPGSDHEHKIPVQQV